MSRVLTLPRNGLLLAATDLHGNVDDLRAVVDRFRVMRDQGRDPQLVICGDLVHGPAISEAAWPEHLGTFYEDRSCDLLDEVAELQRAYPGQIHCLLGNHEHAHVGGPRVDKFHPDEAAHLESLYGTGEFERVRSWIAGWPWVGVAPGAGIVLTHGAPHAQITSAADLEAVPLGGYEHTALFDMAAAGPLGAI